ncbi:hypothetical protein HRJ35_00595 [Shewanella oneidensis MR-1]|uniref:Uncharacterized protein n=1 Tax=Shewanella oneidensis (strain ATCC 700550 / JCM 31522 / CIP 106686 / LMG 19005 / NCIMB 14063 / MR-1) TaxID=211586 RepID=Q8E9F1_SHEON|nr:hypothetical protein [Shewanella oneidensis]AAN57301.1 uncharacterized protein SO_4333 [Shewanella oneidensis MR-1]MDX5998388.1 hypothetical protein [Shewanella oneidensis]MEE2027166.1 hypothetical protein [Shewanella oneidensis]QKG94650.1 hypothetical protein HRJ35_00595 [Shewanella oneidensis MR-1]
MNIYYREAKLCGRKTGNGTKLPFLMNILYSLGEKNRELQPFSIDDIKAVLFNKHQSIGCSIVAPLPIVSWRSEAIWYELFKGEESVYLPQCIKFSNGAIDYAIVVIDDEYELRIWPDCNNREREKHQWFSHHAAVYSEEINVFKECLEALLKHIRKEDDYEAKHPKFGKQRTGSK